jgi:hypothetical protein
MYSPHSDGLQDAQIGVNSDSCGFGSEAWRFVQNSKCSERHSANHLSDSTVISTGLGDLNMRAVKLPVGRYGRHNVQRYNACVTGNPECMVRRAIASEK